MMDPKSDLTPGTHVLIDPKYADPGVDVGFVAVAGNRYAAVNVYVPRPQGDTMYCVRLPTAALTPIHGPLMRDERWYSGRGTADAEVQQDAEVGRG